MSTKWHPLPFLFIDYILSYSFTKRYIFISIFIDFYEILVMIVTKVLPRDKSLIISMLEKNLDYVKVRHRQLGKDFYRRRIRLCKIE